MSGRRISSAVTAAIFVLTAITTLAAQTPIDMSAPSHSLLDYDVAAGVLTIGGANGLGDGTSGSWSSYKIIGTPPAGTDSIYIKTGAGLNVNIYWEASVSPASGTRRAFIATGSLGDGAIFAENVTISSGSGSAFDVDGHIVIINSTISGSTVNGALVHANNNVYIGAAAINVTGSGASGTAVDAGDTVFVLSGTISGRNTAISAGDVIIDNGSSGSAHYLFGSLAMSEVRIEADSAVVDVASKKAAGRVLINNGSAKIINRPVGTAQAVAERGAAIKAGGADILAVDSIAAMGIGTAIVLGDNANPSAINAGVIFSELGTAIRSNNASVTVNGNTIVLSNATGFGATAPDGCPIRIENAAAGDVALNIKGNAVVSATGIRATAVRANKGGGTGALTVIIGDAGATVGTPEISSIDGSAVSLNNGATFVLKSGYLLSEATNGLAVISAAGTVPAGTDIVTVNGGKITASETSGQGSAIRVAGNGGVTVDGTVEITANGTNGRAIEAESGQVTVVGAVKMIVDEGALSIGIKTTTGEVTVTNAEIEVTNGTGIQTAGGAVTVNASVGRTAAVRATVGGTAIRAMRPNAVGRAGTVKIGGSTGNTTIEINSALGRAVHADDSVLVLDCASIGTLGGKAIVGGHVVIGTINGGAQPTVSASGIANVDTAAAITIPSVANASGSITMTNGSITAGTPHASQAGQAHLTAAAINVTGTITGIIRINDGLVEAYGSGYAINSGSQNVDVFIGNISGGAPTIKTGNNGTAITAAGRIQIDGGQISTGSGSKSAAINISGGKTLLVKDGAISAGADGTAIISAAGVTDSIVGNAAVTATVRGTAVNALGRVIVSDNAHISVTSGTALNAVGRITLAGGTVSSPDTGIISGETVSVIGNNVRLSGTAYANANVSGAAAVISPGGAPGAGKKLIIPAGKTFKISERATIAAYEHDTIVIYGSVSTHAATADAVGYFENAGKTVIATGGDVTFGPQTKATLENKDGLFILSTGATLNGAAINYTAWADTLSNPNLRGPGTVRIPPSFTSGSAAVSTEVFKAIALRIPLTADNSGIVATPITFSVSSGDFPVGVTTNGSPIAISQSGWITGLLTAAGEFEFTARAENEAGFAEKKASVTATRIEKPEPGIHFTARLSLSGERRSLGAGTSTVNLRYNGEPVTAEVIGTSVSGYNAAYSGFGDATFWWRNDTQSNEDQNMPRPLTQNAPTELGTYKVFVSFAQGQNFGGISDSRPLELGTLNIIPASGTLSESDRIILKSDSNITTAVNPIIKTHIVEFTAGPNPVLRSSSNGISFFRFGPNVASGHLTIFDASGNLIKRVYIADNSNAPVRREIGIWDLTDSKGRPVSAGTYLVKGVIRTTDGRRENVSQIIGVR